MKLSTETVALVRAAELDATLRSGPDDAVHDALMQVGELCGGLSAYGFVADLRNEIDSYEAEQIAAFGPWIASSAREAAAQNWLTAANGIMERHERAALAVAA